MCSVSPVSFCGRFSCPQCGTDFGWRAAPRTVPQVAPHAPRTAHSAASGVAGAATAVQMDAPPRRTWVEIMFRARIPLFPPRNRCPSRASTPTLAHKSGLPTKSNPILVNHLCYPHPVLLFNTDPWLFCAPSHWLLALVLAVSWPYPNCCFSCGGWTVSRPSPFWKVGCRNPHLRDRFRGQNPDRFHRLNLYS